MECDYSFEMLYKAAFGKSLSKKLKTQLQKSTQEEINQLVKKWAVKAGWTTMKKNGADNCEYLAFYP